MEIVVLCVIILIYKFIKDIISQNDPWYGTERDPFRNNPNFTKSRKRAHDICEKQRKEYEKRTGKKANW